MTELRTPAVDEDGYPAQEAGAPQSPTQPPAQSPASSYGLGEWLRWAWRQLTSMRIALILLFLLALGSIPGSMLPQEGTNPGGVAQYFKSHPTLGPLLNHAGLFNVFGAPWFAAIYLLLFTSLVGCVVPRTFKLAGSARTLPPRAPRNLGRLPHSAEYDTALPRAQALAVADRLLSGHGFRLRRAEDSGGEDSTAGGDWISAEKGYLREVGNLLFHLALLGVLVSVAMGGLFGYKADRLLVAGDTFANTTTDLDEFYPGRLVSGADLPPFTMTLDRFDASYITSGPQEGQPSAFSAHVTYTARPGDPARTFDIQVNHPLNLDGAKVYLIGHGYAPVFRVTDSHGRVQYDQATPFITGTAGNFLSEGVVKAPDAGLGFTGVFVPTAVDVDGTLESIFPAPDHPVVSLIAYGGNLDMNSGASQSVYELDTTGLKQLTARPQVLSVGQTLKLPGGRGSITFTGVQQWASLTITHDPGQVPALVCGMAALAGLLLSFMVRRRRVFVRVRDAGQAAGAGSVVQFGGLARTDASGGFEAEFASLANEMHAAHQQAVPEDPPETQETGD